MEVGAALGNTGLDCVMPAAGASARMGAWKLALPWRGGLAVEAAVAAALAACRRVVLVAGYRAEVLEGLFAGEPRVAVVRNPDWERGMFSSIRRGAAALEGGPFFVSHADLPLTAPELYFRLDAARRGGQARTPPQVAAYWRPTTEGLPGHPVLLPAQAAERLAALDDGASMRAVLAGFEALSIPAAAADGAVRDLDRPEDYFAGLAAADPAAAGPASGLRPFALVLTGSIGAGKTTAAAAAAAALAASGRRVVSALQFADRRDAAGGAAGYTLELKLAGGAGPVLRERLPLCRRVDAPATAVAEAGPDGAAESDGAVAGPIGGWSGDLRLGPFSFDRTAFDRAAAFLAAAAGAGSEGGGGRPPQVLVLDEIGKLELDRGEGLARPLAAFLARAAANAASGAGAGRQPDAALLSVRRDRAATFADGLRAEGWTVAVLDLDQTRAGAELAAEAAAAAIGLALDRRA